MIATPNAIEESQTSSLVNVAQDKKNLSETRNIHLGFAAETELQNLLKCEKIDEEQVLQLRREALVFIRTCLDKLAERNPLVSSIVRNSEAIDPQVMATKTHDVLKKKVKNLIQRIVTLKLIEFETGDNALTDFAKFDVKLQMTSRSFLSSNERNNDLMTFINFA